MALVRFDPSLEVDSLQSEMNRMFDGFFGRGERARAVGRRWIPPMDLAETEDEFVLTADLPGLERDDVAIEIRDNVLELSGERRDAREQTDRGFHRIERSYGRFSRTIGLPDGVEADKIAADFKQGVLEVKIPKPEERKPHRVEISAADGNPAIEADASKTTD